MDKILTSRLGFISRWIRSTKHQFCFFHQMLAHLSQKHFSPSSLSDIDKKKARTRRGFFLIGGLRQSLSQSDFLSLEIYENLQLKSVPRYLDEAFLTELYVNKGLSLRQISKKLGVSRNVLRKQLSEKNIS